MFVHYTPKETTSIITIIMSNQAAWIPEAKGQLQVKEAPMPKAGKGEVVIKNHAVAVNPVDCEYLHMCGLFNCADLSRENPGLWNLPAKVPQHLWY